MRRLLSQSMLLAASLLCLTSPAAADERIELLSDGFAELRPGLVFSVVGARTEYHYLPEAAPKGHWSVSTFRFSSDAQRAWRVVEADGAPAMYQASRSEEPETHPMIVAGDELWGDCQLEVEFTPESDADQCGVAFRYRNDRCYYFLGVDGPRAVLKLVRHGTGFRQPFERMLAEQPYTSSPGERLTAVVSVDGTTIRARLSPDVAFEVEDPTYSCGKIALTADVPTIYHRVTVTADRAAKTALDRAIAARSDEAAAHQAANPEMVVWRKIKTDGFGVGRNLRFGDLDGDGQIDVLVCQPRHHGPKDRNTEVGCLTAMSFDGKQLWQIGEPDPWSDYLTSDVAFQIHDTDGDGRNEVVFVKNMQIVVAEGATGRTLRSVPAPRTPPLTPPPYNRFPRILGDAIHFCNLRGTGRDADMILKDRYLNVWALSERLDVLWHAQCNTGHYPYAEDVDGDGRDEVMVGYTLFGHDGAPLWTLDRRLQDHADGVALVPLRPGGPHRLVCAASDEGMFFADTAGNILRHHYVGHVQNMAVADFRPDLPGLETVSINFWGNQGIVHFYDASGDVYHDFEPTQHGSMCLPINWTAGTRDSGSPGELWVLSADVREGGLFDGHGRRAVRFPADGHPDQTYAVLDVTGDVRDEIVVWDPHEIWVYTQDDNPRSGRLYKPLRNPLYNYSNYQATVSLPGWADEE